MHVTFCLPFQLEALARGLPSEREDSSGNLKSSEIMLGIACRSARSYVVAVVLFRRFLSSPRKAPTGRGRADHCSEAAAPAPQGRDASFKIAVTTYASSH